MGQLSDAFGEGSILIRESVSDRTAAIQIAGELLVASGRVKNQYVLSMLEAVEKFGPYIVIAPGIALAHGGPGEHVSETGLSLLVLRKPVEFLHAENDPVRLVFGLAAYDHHSHITVMAELAGFLSSTDIVNSLITCSDSLEIRARLSADVGTIET